MKAKQPQREGAPSRSDPLLTVEEIAERLRMPPSTVRWKRYTGDFTFMFRVGRRVVAHESAVNQVLADLADRDRLHE